MKNIKISIHKISNYTHVNPHVHMGLTSRAVMQTGCSQFWRRLPKAINRCAPLRKRRRQITIYQEIKISRYYCEILRHQDIKIQIYQSINITRSRQDQDSRSHLDIVDIKQAIAVVHFESVRAEAQAEPRQLLVSTGVA